MKITKQLEDTKMHRRFELQVNLENSAFDGDDLARELGRILHTLGDKVENYSPRSRAALADSSKDWVNVRDSNGNICGKCRFIGRK